MSEHLKAKNEQAPALSQETVPFDVPETISEAEIQQAKDTAAEEHVAREQARKPSVDEARAAVHAAMADMHQQPVLGKKHKLRQLAGMNAYSKKETRRMGQEQAERQDRFWQAEATHQEAFREDNLQRLQGESAAREQSQREQRDQEYETRTREFNETWGSMELSLNQTLQNEAIAARNEQALEPSESNDALAAAQASIAHHEQTKDMGEIGESYPDQSKWLVREMQERGTEFKYQQFDPQSGVGEDYEGVFLLNHPNKQNHEPTVRIYRGVREVDGSILKQSPPVLKGLDQLYRPSGSPQEQEARKRHKEEVKAKIFKFMENPTLENLKSYAEDLAYEGQFASPVQAERLREKLKQIETAVMEKGMSVEDALRDNHVMSFSGGDNIQIDISPYIAASPDANAASFYANGALLAIDVPASQIDGYGELGEVLIKGELSAENIAGVAIRTGGYKALKSTPSKQSNESITGLIPK